MLKVKFSLAQWHLFFITLLVILSRGFLKFRNSGFWAEDGEVYFFDALNQGWRSVFVPIGGYYDLIPRGIAWAATFLPLQWAPEIYIFSSFVVGAFVFSYFASDDFSHIVKEFRTRVCLVIFFCFASGLSEVIGNLVHMRWIIGFWIGLMGLRRLDSHTSTWQWAVFPLICLSGGQAVAYLSLYLFRFWHNRHRREEAFFSACIMISIAFNFYATVQTGVHSSVTTLGIVEFVKVMLHTLTVRFFYYPIFGKAIIYYLNEMKTVAFLFYAIPILFGLIVFQQLRRIGFQKHFILLLLFCAGNVFLLSMVLFIRPSTYSLFQSGSSFVGSWRTGRYSLPISLSGILFFAYVIKFIVPKKTDFAIMIMAGSAILLSIYSGTLQFNYYPWVSFRNELEKYLINSPTCLVDWKIPQSPSGWYGKIPGKVACEVFKSRFNGT